MGSKMALSLYLPANKSGERRLPPDLPGVAPCRLDDAGRLLNHALVLGEVMGVDGSEALQRINEVYGMVESLVASPEVPLLFIEEDLQILRDVYCRIAIGLVAATDENGRPKGDLGKALAASPYVERALDGTLVVKSATVPVTEIREQVQQLCRMLAFAEAEGLLMEMQIV